jgi:hypothetical protein
MFTQFYRRTCVRGAAGSNMCPLRIFVFFFSILIFVYFSLKWTLLDDDDATEKRAARKAEVSPTEQQSKVGTRSRPLRASCAAGPHCSPCRCSRSFV